jgi:hypothetical protein
MTEQKKRVNSQQLYPFPFCIDSGIIRFSELDPKSEKFKCSKGNTFYAIVPNYTPIPTGMGLICIENDGVGITSVKFERDPNFSTLKDCVSMIVWPTPVPNTIPLYFYQGEKYYIPSLKKMPKIQEIEISPLYVLDSKDVGFSCYQNYRCIPDKKSRVSLTECVVNCNQNDPVDIYQYALQGGNMKPGVKKGVFHYTPFPILILLFIIFCLGIIYIYFKVENYIYEKIKK